MIYFLVVFGNDFVLLWIIEQFDAADLFIFFFPLSENQCTLFPPAPELLYLDPHTVCTPNRLDEREPVISLTLSVAASSEGNQKSAALFIIIFFYLFFFSSLTFSTMIAYRMAVIATWGVRTAGFTAQFRTFWAKVRNGSRRKEKSFPYISRSLWIHF